MKYDPLNKLGQGASDFEILMQPFEYSTSDQLEPNWEMIDLVFNCMSSLDEHDQRVLYEIFYDRVTYETLAQNLNIKAKSHAWRKTRIALERLKAAMLKHPVFIEINERNNDKPTTIKDNTK